MKISRELAIKILKYLHGHKNFYFPFSVMGKEYKEGVFVEIESSEWSVIDKGKRFTIFELWENLQNIDIHTLKLMSKGFIEVITGESLENHLKILASNYRNEWKEELWESVDIEEFGLNEFIGGKADAYEECLDIIKKYRVM